MLGTGYPFDMGVTDPLSRLDAIPGLSPGERAAIAGDTVATLLRTAEARSWTARSPR
jgi:hypothetical protein